MAGKAQIVVPDEDLEWIKMKKDFQESIETETTEEKMLRIIKENPLVPLGCFTTAGALTVGLYNFRTGNRKMSQLMMRTRIAAQGLTVVALVAGVLLSYGKKD